MQIALTKKLATAMKINPPRIHEVVDPIFSWTANWTKVWDNRRAEDMLVLVNNETRFVVAIYEVKRNSLKNVAEMMKTAILNTLLSMNLNPDLVAEYMRMSGEVEFVQNSSRKASSWVSKAGMDCALYVASEYNGIPKMFNDTVGSFVNRLIVNCSGAYKDAFYPYVAMINALSKVTGRQAYKYRAFELLVTLDLDIYKAVRKIIVPADIQFKQLHKVLQSVFEWKNYHLYDFTVFDKGSNKMTARIVPSEEDLEYDNEAILMGNHTLSEFLSKQKYIIYTYDMGDSWQHEIQLIDIIDEYHKESPYLLEASGQTPPEDVGGVPGFINFREIMMNPNSPEYKEMQEWAGYWTVELGDWEKRPRVITRI
ncbi:plasmid pRiA4b ORF-3 family protein [Clostridium sp. JN-9]|uniref:plasmid pRiA4b ORF-3 family protein n=1 Tax=Clostridium sp. JN-9 TaxID=2507159 RepID=UPI000FFE1F36|nr:plasmid pRiA4b ORF-3 family protein [Clostridium sp. JN-9]QAT40649.1 plasmid pRiA4b ORF-3 family protein [Clostridium sp. JN-9]